MSKTKQFIVIGLLIGFLISTIGLIVILGIILTKNPNIVQTNGVIQNTVIVPNTVIVEVTPTPTNVPSPTNTVFPQSKDRIVFLSVWEKDYYIINADGTDLARITNDGNHQYCPIWNPDGKRISFVDPSVDKGYYDVIVMDADGHNRKFLFKAKLDLQYGQMPKWSPDGSKLAFSAFDESGKDRIYVFDGNSIKRLTNSNSIERLPEWSPEGDKIAFVSYEPRNPLYVAHAITWNMDWLISIKPASFTFPLTWSPDGKRLAFISGEDLYTANFNDINNLQKRTTFSNAENFAPSWSPDGNTIAYYVSQVPCCNEVVFISANNIQEEPVETNVLSEYRDSPITWSHDGKRIAIVSNTNTKNWNIYVVDTSGNSIKITESDRKDDCPNWSP